MISPVVTLYDGSRLGFSQLAVTRSLEQLSSVLSLNSFDWRPDAINRAISVKIGNVPIFTGTVEEIKGRARQGFSITARSLTARLTKWDADGTEQFRDSQLLTVLSSIARPVSVEIPAAPPLRVNRFRLKKSESLERGIQRLAEAKQFVVSDDGRGRLLVFRDPPPATEVWQYGKGTVLDIEVSLNYAQLVNEYSCRGQREILSLEASDSSGQFEQSLLDVLDSPSRRILSPKLTLSRADAAAFVDWTAKKELGSAVRVIVEHDSLPGSVGEVIRLIHPELGIDDEFIISSLSIAVGEQQSRVSTFLTFPDVYVARKRITRAAPRRVSNWKILDGVRVVTPDEAE